MRTLAITQNVTLDGSIEMLANWFDPQSDGEVGDSDLQAELRSHNTQADGLLLGRKTYEDFRGFWPNQTEDPTGVTQYLNEVQKYVVSSTLTDPKWMNTTILSGDFLDRVSTLKAQTGKDIVVTGSISLCHSLIAAGLVDEYRLFVYPVVQGKGRRLFPPGYSQSELRLVEVRAFCSGIAFSRYRVA